MITEYKSDLRFFNLETTQSPTMNPLYQAGEHCPELLNCKDSFSQNPNQVFVVLRSTYDHIVASLENAQKELMILFGGKNEEVRMLVSGIETVFCLIFGKNVKEYSSNLSLLPSEGVYYYECILGAHKSTTYVALSMCALQESNGSIHGLKVLHIYSFDIIIIITDLL